MENEILPYDKSLKSVSVPNTAINPQIDSLLDFLAKELMEIMVQEMKEGKSLVNKTPAAVTAGIINT